MAVGDVLVRVGADVGGFVRSLKLASASTVAFGGVVAGVGGAVAGGMAAMAGASALGIGALIKHASNFESQFVGVRKVLEETSTKGFGQLQQELRDMSKVMPHSTEEILGVARAAGQLGIGIDDISAFTEVMLDLGATTEDLSAEEAAMSIARFANIMQMDMGKVSNFGSSLTHLGNNFAVSEGQILRMAMRLAGAGKQIGLTEAEVLAFSSVLSSLGIPIESGGTAFSRVFLEMQAAIMEGGDKLDAFSSTAGMTAKDFATAFDKDPANAIVSFIEGLGGISDEGGNVMEVLDNVGLSELRVRDALLRSINATDLYRAALKGSTEAWEENVALKKEAEQVYGTFASQLKILWNRVKDLALIIGTPLMHALSDFLTILDPIISFVEGLGSKFQALDDDTKKIVAVFILLVPIVLAVGAAITGIIVVAALLIAKFTDVSTQLKLAAEGFSRLLPTITAISGPVLLIIGVLALLTAAVVALWMTNEDFRQNVTVIWESIKSIISSVFEAVMPLGMAFIGVLLLMVQAMMPLVEWVVGVAAAFAEWIAKTIEANQWITTLFQMLVVLGALFVAFKVSVAIVTGVMGLFSAAMGLATGLATAFGVVMAVLTSPITIVIAIIAAVITIIVLLGKRFEWLGDIVSAVTDWISDKWNSFLGFFGKGTEEAADKASTAISDTKDSGKRDMDELAKAGADYSEKLKTDVNGNVSMMQTETTAAFGKMKDDGRMEAAYMKDLVTGEITQMNGKVIGEAEDMNDKTAKEFADMGGSATDITALMSGDVSGDIGDMTGNVTGDTDNMESLASGDFDDLHRNATGSSGDTNAGVSKDFAELTANVSDEMGNTETTASKSMSGIEDTMSTGMSNVKSTTSDNMSGMGEEFTKSLSLMNKGAEASFNTINRTVSQKTKQMMQSARSATTAMSMAYRTAFMQIQRAVTTGMNGAVRAVQHGNKFITANVRSLNSHMYNAGLYAMSGLARGLRANQGYVNSVARNIAAGVSNTLRKALKVKSPSRVTMEIGGYVGDGLAKGILNARRVVNKAADMLGESAIPKVNLDYATPSGSLPSLSSAVNGAVDVETRDGALVTAIEELRTGLRDLKIEMDGREVGRITEPHVSEMQGNKTESRDRFHR